MLKELREKKGITQVELRNETGVSIRTIAKIESGDESVQYRLLKELAKYFNVNVEELYK